MKKFLKMIIGNKKIKRWILLIVIGMLVTCYEFAKIMSMERLELADTAKIIITFIAGFTCFILGLVFLQRRTLELAANPDIMKKDDNKENEAISKGPNVVVIGGGEGLSTVLKGLKKYTSNLTAIVIVSKYGKKDAKATEDIRLSVEALAQNSEEMTKMLDYNFETGKLKGLSFGDVYMQTAENIYGDFVSSVNKTKEIFSMVGQVLPVTLDEMKICVELDNGMTIEDKDKIADITEDKVTKINRVYISPSNCRTAPGVIESIQNADAIVLGPGSLYTNVIPNLLIKNVAKTIKESKAFKIYIPNIMTQPGHTDDYDVSDHINAIVEHAGNKIIDYCICDNGDIVPEFLRKYNKEGANLVEVDSQNLRGKGIKLVKADISCIDGEYIRHDPDELAKAIIELICNELKFKDKQTDEQYLLLNSKLKEEKKKNKKPKKVKPKKEKVSRKASKFRSKYNERIKSIQESDETRLENIKLYEKAKEITDEEEQKEKERFIKETYQSKK